MVIQNKAVIIGLDGATWTLLRPWIDQGHCLIWRGWFRRGLRAADHHHPAGVGFGVGVVRHRLQSRQTWRFRLCFPQPGGYDIGVINVQVRAVPPFWKTIEEAGGQVGLMSVPITYPPQPIRGFTVNGFLVPNEQSAYTYPLELKEELKREGNAGRCMNSRATARAIRGASCRTCSTST